jgi:predicted SprT family Zn-dependent metalloprotease
MEATTTRNEVMTTLSEYLHKHDLLGRIDTGVDKLGLHHETVNEIFDEFHKWVVVINYRAKCRAGAIHPKDKKLSLTHKFFECKSRNNDHVDTLLHEVAHVITDIVYPHTKVHHGREWKSIMIALGMAPDRCHYYEYMGTNKQPKHEYKCKDCGHIIHTKRALIRAKRRIHGLCKYKPNGGHLTHTQLR